MRTSGKRRQFSSVVTEEAISNEIRRFRSFLRDCEHQSVPPTTDTLELKCRQAACNDVATRILFGALVALKEYEPGHYVALLSGGAQLAKSRLKGEQAVLAIRRPQRGQAFVERLHGPAFVAAHDLLKRRLQKIWSQPATAIAGGGGSRFAGRTGRYGRPQHVGCRRYHARQRERSAAVRREAQDLLRWQDDGVERMLDERTALRIVRSCKTPAPVSVAVLAHLFGLSPRSMKAILNHGAKDIRAGEIVHDLLDRWGYKRGG